MTDPQLANNYSYARNNPLLYTDPTGLDVTFKCDSTKNCEDATNKFNNRSGHQFTVKLGKGNVLTVVGKVDTSKLSQAELALYKAVTDTKNHATVMIQSQIKNEDGTPQLDVAIHVSKGVNSVDLENTSKFDAKENEGGLNSGDVIAHEALDAYYSLSMSANNADLAAAEYFPGLLPPENNVNNVYRVKGQGDYVDKSKFTQRISDGRGSEVITVTYSSPIPWESVNPSFVNQESRAERVREIGGRVTGVKYVPKD